MASARPRPSFRRTSQAHRLAGCAIVMRLKEPERTEGILDSLPRGINTTNVTMNPGGLPPEIWYTIMDYIDDGRMLFTCAFTCKLLAARAMKMTKPLRMCRTPQMLFNDLIRRPIVGHFLREVIVPPALLPRLMYECAGKLHALRIIRIYGTSKWPCKESLMRHRPPYLAFASTFYTVTELRLSCIKLWSSRDFLRLVCAFPSLRALSSFDVSWDRDEGRTLAEEPFAKALCLQKIEISDRENISPYKCLLSAPELLQSIKYVEFSKGGRSNWSVELTLQETSPLGETPVCHHPSRKAHAVVRDKYGSRGPPVEWLRGSFDLLDVFLISPSVSCVDIDVEMKIPDEALLNVLRTDPFPFPALRARGVLQVTAFSGLDIKTLEWGCTDIFIRRRQVED